MRRSTADCFRDLAIRCRSLQSVIDTSCLSAQQWIETAHACELAAAARDSGIVEYNYRWLNAPHELQHDCAGVT